MDISALIKDESIKHVLQHLILRFGADNFKLMDHWEADLLAIGLSDPMERRLIYISTYGQPEGIYFVSLEDRQPEDESAGPGTSRDLEQVNLARLEQLMREHWGIQPR